MAANVLAAMSAAVSDKSPPLLLFRNPEHARLWLNEMSSRLARRIPDRKVRTELLKTVHHEAMRAGLDPQLVLGLMEVESGFRKYAISSAGARGFMQVMPFWTKLIGKPDHNLFHVRLNVRYGCVILRHYLDIENGDYYRALGRYNGSLGKPEYPTLVHGAWKGKWAYAGATS
jgi:soluble lytic murein transglycosylase-like protein